MKKSVLNMAIVVSLFVLGAFSFGSHAQVTIGDNKHPEAFSALELISDGVRGLRLPQLDAAQRTALEAVITGHGQARGLMIYNMDTDCVDTWNGEEWISQCAPLVCRARINSGWLRFMCHNLGADESADPFTPSSALHGHMYRFGAKNPSLPHAQNITNSGAVTGWNTSNTLAFPFQDDTNDWSSANNPCPEGWRLPTRTEWEEVIDPDNNTLSWTTPSSLWGASAINFDVGMTIGSGSNRVFLPAAGWRLNLDGQLYDRGSRGCYWSSTGTMGNGAFMNVFNNSTAIGNMTRPIGRSVRCVQ